MNDLLEWNVYWEDFNKNQIIVRNVFNLSSSFNTYLKENFKKNNLKEDFCKQLERDLQYCYWSKCEYEIIISSWLSKDDCEIKIDVYDQIMINWDKFCNYVWENKSLIKKL